ncbi:MAG: hypothetical protein OQK35_02625 [Alphaproteobacteria bacterium]|nr:hypothetical protein [Rhodospirillales bacterium]MCW9045203.1 hypothetical protein [Alphaproteobacteria bacterium]
MRIQRFVITGVIVIGVALSIAIPTFAHDYNGSRGHGMMGPNWGNGYDWCPYGMMGPRTMKGAGPNQMQPIQKELSTTDVQQMMEQRLTWQGNPNLKLGKVEERDASTIIAEVVTKEGSLVQKFEINRYTGWIRGNQ